jgi:hypothetical protein
VIAPPRVHGIGRGVESKYLHCLCECRVAHARMRYQVSRPFGAGGRR